MIRARVVRGVAAAAGFLVVVELVFNPPADLYIFGAANGALYGLIAVGIVLVYRTNRIINFAATAIGAIAAVTATLLQVAHGLPYWGALPLALIGGAACGALVDFVVVRRFSRAPRLVLTIATLAVVQVLALANQRIAARLRSGEQASRVPTPWRALEWRDARGTPILTGDHMVAVIAVVAICIGLAAFLRYTRLGIGLRASAENADRALLLGIPVRTVTTVSWVIAGFIGAVAVFLRIPLVGVPVDPTLGFGVLLYVVAAAVVARLDSIPIALATGVGIGILEQASVAKTGTPNLTSAMMLAIVLVVLLIQRRPQARALDTGISTWQSVAETRSVPFELRKLPEITWAKAGFGVVAVVGVLVAPALVSAGQLVKLTVIPLTAIVAVSLVVLTGWAGQVSLGQFGLAGVGAGVAGGLVANHHADFFVAMVAGIGAGVAVAVLIGLPAARIRGVYFAVTTLAFAATMQFYFLRRGYVVHRVLLPHGEAPRVRRPLLYDSIDLNSDLAFYFVAVVFLGLALALAWSFRRSRTGRVVIAARDNERAALAYGINLTRARLTAFAFAGGLAAMSGVLFAYHQGSVDAGAYGVAASISVFLVAVLGGLTSLTGTVVAVCVLMSVQYFVEPHFTGASLLFEGPLLLLVLVLRPNGIGGAIQAGRERFLVTVARRRRIDVPSLTADRRVTPEPV